MYFTYGSNSKINRLELLWNLKNRNGEGATCTTLSAVHQGSTLHQALPSEFDTNQLPCSTAFKTATLNYEPCMCSPNYSVVPEIRLRCRQYGIIPP